MKLKNTAGFKFIIAVPICSTVDETWSIIESYLELEPGGFMVGVGGRLPIISPSGHPELVDYEGLSRFIEELKRRYPQGFIAVDGEGGDIFNVLRGGSPLKSPRYYYDAGTGIREEELSADVAAHATMLADAGVDMNFAPLLDVPLPGYTGYAAGDNRCISDTPEDVARFAEIFIDAHRQQQIICTAKHFPGYGHLTRNPHRILSEESASWNEDLALSPYRRLIGSQNLDAVMLGHSTTALHQSTPATLATEALKLLREDLGFNGLAVADELFMGAVNEYYRDPVSGRTDGDPSGETRAIDAWKLNDLIIVSYPVQNLDGTVSGVPGGEERLGRMVGAVQNALDTGRIDPAAAVDSLARLTSSGLLG